MVDKPNGYSSEEKLGPDTKSFPDGKLRKDVPEAESAVERL